MPEMPEQLKKYSFANLTPEQRKLNSQKGIEKRLTLKKIAAEKQRFAKDFINACLKYLRSGPPGETAMDKIAHCFVDKAATDFRYVKLLLEMFGIVNLLTVDETANNITAPVFINDFLFQQLNNKVQNADDK